MLHNINKALQCCIQQKIAAVCCITTTKVKFF